MRKPKYGRQVQRFADDYGMDPREVYRMVLRADFAMECAEHQCNGDSYPTGEGSEPTADKNKNAELWGKMRDLCWKAISDIATPYGFTAVTSTGLRPCLKRGEQFVEIPEA